MKITALNPLSAAPASGDLVAIVDVSDTSMAASGSTKKIAASDLLSGVLALSGGTMSGNLSLGSNGLTAGTATLNGPSAATALTVADFTSVATAYNRVNLLNTMWNPGSGRTVTLKSTITAKGLSGVANGAYAMRTLAQDHSGVNIVTVTNATRSGTTVTVTANGHGYANNDKVQVYDITHTFNQEVNGEFTITNVTTNTFDYTVASLSSGAYTSGGAVTNRPYVGGLLVEVSPRVVRNVGSRASQHADDAVGIAIQNISGVSTAKATDAFYLAASPSVTGDSWTTAFNSDANVQIGYRLAGNITVAGLDMSSATFASGAPAIRIGGAVPGNSPRIFSQQQYDGTQSGNINNAYFYSQAKGARDTGHFLYNVLSQIQEPLVTANKTITNATRVSTTITITANAHGYANGDRIIVDSVTHTFNQEINGTWVISNVTTNTFDYTVAGVSSGSYTSGGIATNRPGYSAYLALVAPAVSRGGLAGTNLHADDVSGFFVSNNGTAKATDAYYLGRNASLATEWDTVASYDGATTYGLLVNNVVGAGTAVLRGTTYGASGIPEVQLRMARGTFDSGLPRRTKSADVLARFSGVPFVAADDSTAATVAGVTTRIDFFANEDQTASAQGSRIVFYTTPIGSNTIAEKVRIANADGFDFTSGTFSTYMMRLKNNTNVVARNNANSADVTLFRLTTSDHFQMMATLNFQDSVNVVLGTTNGTQLGAATNQKLAFHGSTAVIQRAGAAQAAVTTTAATQTTPWGFSTQAQADAIVTLVNELRAALVEKGLIKGAA